MSRHRRAAMLGAASSLGIRPYDDRSEPRHLDRAPDALRRLGVPDRLSAADLGDVIPADAYRDFTRPRGGVRNERAVERYSRVLADRVASGLADERFLLVLGGDCSIVLGCLLGASRHAARLGLAYVDDHADFATPAESITGSAASMCLAMAVGRGGSPLSRLAGQSPLVRAEDVVLFGRRDEGQDYYGHDALASSGILDVPWTAVAVRPAAAAAAALARLDRPEIDGFWIHLDADVLDARVMPAVDSPEPDGPDIEQLAGLLAPITRHPKALGLQLTIYDPALDDDGVCAARLAALLDATLAPASDGVLR